MEPVKTFVGQIVALAINDIDTDQIIPARFLKTTDSEGLGKNLFADWRYEADGTPKADFVLNQPQHADATVLVGGANFGLWQLARARALGVERRWLPRGRQHQLRRHFPQQRAAEWSAAVAGG